jgi:alpha-tubulin suppressor-like RCC1 family protein
MEDIIQLVAYETGFVALSRDGKVWTWGDERYASTLGREITGPK